MLIKKFLKLFSYDERKSILNGLNFGFSDNQYFLASFPKSGNTWVRFILSYLTDSSKEIPIKRLGEFIPDFHVLNQLKLIEDSKNNFREFDFQFIKTHESFSKFYKNKNIILVVRDGRDVITSYYHYINSRTKKQTSIENIIRNENIHRFGSWTEHFNSWKDHITNSSALLKYEDLLEDPFKHISKLLKYIDWEKKDHEIINSIEKSSFKSLQKNEEKNGITFSNKINDNSVPFFRSGKSGNWKNHFSDKDHDIFWKLHGETMRTLNYKK